MRSITKVMCLVLALLSPAITANTSETSTVKKKRPITFHAERGIFLSAEILNPWTDNQILKVVLPDSTILYRDLKTNEIWKEYSQGAVLNKSTTLTEYEYNLLTGIDLDTGWIPRNVPLQVRLVFVASLGEIVADLPGDIELTYDDDDIQIGQELDAQVGWDGDYYGGNLHLEAGLDFSAKWRVCVDWPLYWCDDNGEDFVPPINYGFNTDCGFTPFLLNGTEYCNAPIISKDFMFPLFQIPFLLKIEIGAELGGSVTGELAGSRICGMGAGNDVCIYQESDTKPFPIQINDCSTPVSIINEYSSSFNLNWIAYITPKGCVTSQIPWPVPAWQMCFDPVEISHEIFDINLPLDFNEPFAQFEIEADAPHPPPWLSCDPGCGYIDIDWPPVSGATDYCIYRDGSRRTCVSGTSWRDNNPGTSTRCYRVTARNDCGESGKSPQDCAKAKFPPPSPGWCYATDDKCGYVEICWPNVPGEDGYRIYRNGSQIGSTGANQTCYTDYTIDTHSYCVKAYNSCGESNCSPPDNGTGLTTPPPPPPPTVVAGCDSINVSWSSVSGATEYCIYRDGEWQDCVTETFCPDDDPADTLRCYQITAKNECGESTRSGSSCSTALSSPDRPDSIWCVPSEPVVGEPFELGWQRVDGTTQFDLTENSDLIYSGADTFFVLIHDSVNSYFYGVSACNQCGCEGGAIELDIDIALDVQDIRGSTLPDHFALSQNYPNPFNPETRIEFALPTRSYVTIDVYDIAGRRIRNLAGEQLSAGLKAVTWDGRDDNGQLVSSGIYFYRIAAGDFTESRKMVLLK